jgi:hypothetical protein
MERDHKEDQNLGGCIIRKLVLDMMGSYELD